MTAVGPVGGGILAPVCFFISGVGLWGVKGDRCGGARATVCRVPPGLPSIRGTGIMVYPEGPVKLLLAVGSM